MVPATVSGSKGLVVDDSTREERVTGQTLAYLISCPTFSPIPTLGGKELRLAECSTGPAPGSEVCPCEVGVRSPLHR